MRPIQRCLGIAALIVLCLAALTATQAGDAKKPADEPPALGAVSVEGKLEPTDPPDRLLGGPCRMYRFQFHQGRTYQVDMISRALDSYLHLEDPAGNVLISDDDSGGALNSRIIYLCPKDGEYQVVCTALGRNPGPFTLRVTETIPNRPVKAVAPPPAGKPIDVEKQNGSVTINDQLNAGDVSKLVANKVAKEYVVTLKKGQTYQIDQTSPNLDSYLHLFDPAGKQLAFDDDSGGFPSARIVQRIDADGDYTIISTSFGSRSTGAFTLTVKKQ